MIMLRKDNFRIRIQFVIFVIFLHIFKSLSMWLFFHIPAFRTSSINFQLLFFDNFSQPCSQWSSYPIPLHSPACHNVRNRGFSACRYTESKLSENNDHKKLVRFVYNGIRPKLQIRIYYLAQIWENYALICPNHVLTSIRLFSLVRVP